MVRKERKKKRRGRSGAYTHTHTHTHRTVLPTASCVPINPITHAGLAS